MESLLPRLGYRERSLAAMTMFSLHTSASFIGEADIETIRLCLTELGFALTPCITSDLVTSFRATRQPLEILVFTRPVEQLRNRALIQLIAHRAILPWRRRRQDRLYAIVLEHIGPFTLGWYPSD